MAGTHFPDALTGLEFGDHLCYLYETEKEHQVVLTSYLRQGLEQGEKVIYVLDSHSAQTILDYLKEDGLDIKPYLGRGQLVVLNHDDTYLRNGVFDPDEMIALLRTEMEWALAGGYSALRVTGEMSWALRGLPGSEWLIEYEARLNEFFPGSRCVGLCQYDRRRFEPPVLLDVLRAHPVVIVGTEVYANLCYIPPSELLKDDLPAVELRYWLLNLAAHKRAGLALKESEERYRSIADSIQDGLTIIEDGKVVYVNERACQIFGYPRDELIQLTGLDVAVPEERERLRRVAQEARQTGVHPTELEFWITRKDGARRCVSNRYAAIPKGGGVLCRLVVTTDVTERVRVEEALAQSESRLRSTLASMDDLVFVFDQQTRFVDAYAPEEELYLSLEAFLGKKHSEVMPSDIDQLFAKAFDKNKTGEVVEYEYPLEIDGKTKWYAAKLSPMFLDGEFAGSVAVIRDITKRVQTESQREAALEALQESEMRFRAVVTGAPIVLFVLDREGAFTFVEGQVLREGQALRAVGIEPGDLVGQTIFDVFPNLPQLEERFDRALDGELTISVDRVFEWSFETRLSPLRGQDGQVVGVVGVATDVTERERIAQYALRTERLAAMGHMAAALAHEIKNPLQAIGSNLELVLDFALEPKEREQHLYLCRQEIERLVEIARRILSFAQPGQDARRQVSAAQLVQQALTLARQPLQNARVRVTVDVPAGDQAVRVVPDQIVQVLLNLIVNVVKAMPGGGNLRVTTRAEKDMLTLVLTADALSVPPEQVEHVFDPFGAAELDSLGFGLSLGHIVVQGHGGSLSVEDLGDDQGVAFTLTLPLALSSDDL